MGREYDGWQDLDRVGEVESCSDYVHTFVKGYIIGTLMKSLNPKMDSPYCICMWQKGRGHRAKMGLYVQTPTINVFIMYYKHALKKKKKR